MTFIHRLLILSSTYLDKIIEELTLPFCSASQGISFDEFRSFFQFLNNLEDFAIAMQMYNFASRSIGQGK